MAATPRFSATQIETAARHVIAEESWSSFFPDLAGNADFKGKNATEVVGVVRNLLSEAAHLPIPHRYAVPKSPIASRFVAALTFPQKVALQVLVEPIADEIDRLLGPRSRVAGFRMNRSGSRAFFESGVNAWVGWHRASLDALGPGDQIIAADLLSYFDHIRFRDLEVMLEGSSLSSVRTVCLMTMLRNLSDDQSGALPQELPASTLVANWFLVEADEFLAHRGIRAARYMDDWRIVVATRKEAEEVCLHLSDILRQKNLHFSPTKTSIPADKEAEKTLDPMRAELEALQYQRQIHSPERFALARDVLIEATASRTPNGRALRMALSVLAKQPNCALDRGIRQRALNLLPRHPELTRELCRFLLTSPNFPAVERRIVDAIADDPVSDWVEGWYARVLLARKRIDTATLSIVRSRISRPERPLSSSIYIAALARHGTASDFAQIAGLPVEQMSSMEQRAYIAAMGNSTSHMAVSGLRALRSKPELSSLVRLASTERPGAFIRAA